MDRTERFYKIIKILKTRSNVNLQDFLDEIEISRATFNRDLEYLRDRFNAPIEYHRENNSYQLNESERKFELPGIWLSAGEASSLLSFLQLLEHMEPGSLHDATEPFRQQLIHQLDTDDLEINDFIKRIRIISITSRQIEPRYFELISFIVLKRQQASIEFYNRSRDEIKWRHISPQRLVHYRDNWYLDAWDHDKEKLRTFSLACVKDIKLLSEPAQIISEHEIEKEVAKSYGIFAGTPTHIAKLRFTPERARWVATECWHPEQTGEYDKEGYYYLSIPYHIEHELVMDILKYGSHVKVVSPLSLKKIVTDSLKDAIGQYE